MAEWTEAAYFRKKAPTTIDLPVIDEEHLAMISLQHIEARGYELSVGNNSLGSAAERLQFMQQIVKQKYGKATILERNAYLAMDCVDMAVARKNVRVQDAEAEYVVDSSLFSILAMPPAHPSLRPGT